MKLLIKAFISTLIFTISIGYVSTAEAFGNSEKIIQGYIVEVNSSLVKEKYRSIHRSMRNKVHTWGDRVYECQRINLPHLFYNEQKRACEIYDSILDLHRSEGNYGMAKFCVNYLQQSGWVANKDHDTGLLGLYCLDLLKVVPSSAWSAGLSKPIDFQSYIDDRGPR